MRLWSLHPKYLDRVGLVALWRESLLAQKVLTGETAGYRNHPQLERFRAQPDPRVAMAAYLGAVFEEAERRGYRFDETRIRGRAGTARCAPRANRIQVKAGQLRYEVDLLCGKLANRDSEMCRRIRDRSPATVEPHPLFDVVEGEIEPWERVPAGK